MYLRVVVKPNARGVSVEEVGKHSYKVSLKSPAVEGKANEELVEVLAQHFGVSKNMVEIISGLRSRIKRVSVS